MYIIIFWAFDNVYIARLFWSKASHRQKIWWSVSVLFLHCMHLNSFDWIISSEKYSSDSEPIPFGSVVRHRTFDLGRRYFMAIYRADNPCFRFLKFLTVLVFPNLDVSFEFVTALSSDKRRRYKTVSLVAFVIVHIAPERAYIRYYGFNHHCGHYVWFQTTYFSVGVPGQHLNHTSFAFLLTCLDCGSRSI